MSAPTACRAVYPTLAVPDVRATCDWYVTKLGFLIRFLWGDPPTHGAILLDQACVHFWQGDPHPTPNWLYFDVSDLDAMYQRALSHHLDITRPPETYPWGMREFKMIDPNGYPL